MASSSSDEDFLLLESTYVKYRKRRTVSLSDINRKRTKYGTYYHLFLKDIKDDEKEFYDYTRMTQETFYYILNLIEHRLIKKWCNWHVQPISPEERLVITIRYLATGESFKSLSKNFRIGVTTLTKIIEETVLAIWEELYTIHMPTPTRDIFYSISNDFNNIWNFPHVIGCIDGKHVRVMCPKKSGSMFYNYKKYFSVVLQAVADANYKFVMVEVGGYGKQSDGGTFRASDLYQFLNERELDIPSPAYLPNTQVSVPYVFLADEAYPLKTYLMKPFGGRDLTVDQQNFNSRLSRARKTVECAFGRLYSKWRLLSKSIETDIQLADKIVKTMCLLHNIIIDKEGFERNLTSVNIVRRRWHNQRLSPPSNVATNVRNNFVQYFKHNHLLYN
ncbi:uncharacterized protein LOC125061459 [Pieris napi]|uniref:uncharacterized protein LOC125061459 n=1 Tax=Pieris napi TaxID=78633 RepID=UPI001FBA4C1B|nr:uncharacterized protein LOC125061459 [Pieris napi]